MPGWYLDKQRYFLHRYREHALHGLQCIVNLLLGRLERVCVEPGLIHRRQHPFLRVRRFCLGVYRVFADHGCYLLPSFLCLAAFEFRRELDVALFHYMLRDLLDVVGAELLPDVRIGGFRPLSGVREDLVDGKHPGEGYVLPFPKFVSNLRINKNLKMLPFYLDTGYHSLINSNHLITCIFRHMRI